MGNSHVSQAKKSEFSHRNLHNQCFERINSLMCFLLFLTRNFLCKKVNQVFLQFYEPVPATAKKKKSRSYVSDEKMKKKSHHANQWEKRKEWRWSRRGKAEKNLEWMFTLCSKCRQIIRPISSYTGYIWWLKQQQQHTSNLSYSLQLITLHIRWEKWKMLNACALISHMMTESVKKCIVTLTLWLQFFSFIDVDSGQIDISTALSLLFFFHFLLMIPTKEFSMLKYVEPEWAKWKIPDFEMKSTA